MNMKLLAGFGVVLVIILGLPLVAGLMPPSSQGGAAPAADGKGAPPVPNDPPLLTNANLAGSVWEIKVSGFPIQITLNGGGQAVAYTDNFIVKQMAGTDTLAGTWRVEGNALIAAVNFQNKDHTVKLHISGNDVYHEGKKINRVR